MGFLSRAGISWKKLKRPPELKPLFPKLTEKYPPIKWDYFGPINYPAVLEERRKRFLESERFRALPKEIQEKILSQR